MLSRIESRWRPAAVAVGQVGLTFAVAALASIIGLHFQIEAGVSILYPLTAVSIVSCMAFGLRGAAGTFLGVLATPWGSYVTPLELVISGVLTAMEGLIPWLVFRVRKDLAPDLRDLRSLLAFLLFGAVLNNALASLLGNLLVVDHPPGVLLVWRQVFMWWISDFTAALLLATPALAFGGVLMNPKNDRPRTLTNVLQVVAVILFLGFGASFAIRFHLLDRLERERLAQQERWRVTQEKLDRMHSNFIRAAFLTSSDPAAPARLEIARRVNDAFLRDLGPSITASSPALAGELPAIASATTQWFADARARLEGRRTVEPREAAENGRYILALRVMIERANSQAWDDYAGKRHRIMIVATVVDAVVFVTLTVAAVMLLYTISRPFSQVGLAIAAMREGRPPGTTDVDARYLEFRTIAGQLQQTWLELRRREEELRLQTARAVEASRHKSEFLAKMSHELRTPLNSIIGFSDLLTEQEATISPEKRLGFLENVGNSARHLLNLINDLLDIAKVESGKMKLHLEPLDLRLSIANTVASTQPLFERKKQPVTIDVPPEPMTVRADSARIEQVLLNLLSNANKFSPEGEGITVRGTRSGAMWQVEVQDRGIGIHPDDHQRIFDEFEQVVSRPLHSAGTGLGLALVRRFVHAHGGDIDVQSAPGAGATFRVRLPAG